MNAQLVLNQQIGIVGLGYVGLTLATVMADVGYQVVGVEKKQSIVDLTNEGIPHFSENGLKDVLSNVVSNGKLKVYSKFQNGKPCQVYIITVGTPLNSHGQANLELIQAATNEVAQHMNDDALVILRSTVKIGTTRNIVAPILEASGKRFSIAMCPERTLEGKALQELRELPQIIGADSKEVRNKASDVFSHLTKSIVQVTSLESAEIIKLVDNTYRDVHFGFANEVARICELFGVNSQEVITSGKLGYKRTNVPMPGLVGGPCLEKDPHILLQSVRDLGMNLEITNAGRTVNERQPIETTQFIAHEMDKRGIESDAKVAVLGIAFKGIPATDDLRGSMSLKVIESFRKIKPDVNLHVFDNEVKSTVLKDEIHNCTVSGSFNDAIKDASVVIIANNHPELGKIAPVIMKKNLHPNGFIYDYWNHFSNQNEVELGDFYFAVGNTRINN